MESDGSFSMLAVEMLATANGDVTATDPLAIKLVAICEQETCVLRFKHFCSLYALAAQVADENDKYQRIAKLYEEYETGLGSILEPIMEGDDQMGMVVFAFLKRLKRTAMKTLVGEDQDGILTKLRPLVAGLKDQLFLQVMEYETSVALNLGN